MTQTPESEIAGSVDGPAPSVAAPLSEDAPSGVDDVLAAEAQKRPQEPEPETNLRVVEW